MSTPPRTAAVEAMRGLRMAEHENAKGQRRAPRGRTNKAKRPRFTLGNRPPNDPENMEPNLEEKGVVLVAPGYAATGKEAEEAAWRAYNEKYLANRPYPKEIDPRKGPKKEQTTKRRTRRPSINNANLYKPPNNGNMRTHAGGRRRRAQRRLTRNRRV